MLFQLFDPLNKVITGDKLFEVFLWNPGIEKFEHLLAVFLITPLGSKNLETADNLGCTVLQFKLCLTEICTILIKEFETGSVSIPADMTVGEVISMFDTLFPDFQLLVFRVFWFLTRQQEDEKKQKEHQGDRCSYEFVFVFLIQFHS